MTHAVRRARLDDAPRLTEIALAAKRHWGYPAGWIDAWRDGLTFRPEFIEANPVYIASFEDRIVACYALVIAEARIRLEHLWVEPASMTRGIGRALFVHAVETARNCGGVVLEIDSDPNAEAFYARLGARRVSLLRTDVCGQRRALPRMEFDLCTA